MAKSKMSSQLELERFLNMNKRTGDNPYTHTTLPNMPISYPGSYVIDKKRYNKFLQLYHNSVFRDGNKAYLTERHLDFAPILIDLDFRFPPEKKLRQYGSEFINKFLDIYMDHINSIVDEDLDDIEIFVLEKTKPKYVEEKNLVKDGIHIMIPSIITFPRIQYILRYRAIHDTRMIALFNELGQINSIDDVIDNCVIEKNNWQMYGSRKPNCEAYEVTKVYNYSNKVLTQPDTKYTTSKLLDLLSLRNIGKEDLIELADEAMEGLDKDYDIMPGNFKGIRRNKVNKRKRKRSPKRLRGDTITTNKELEKIEKLVDLLLPKRAECYETWIQVGWCLHNIDHRLLQAWISFSKKSSKYEAGVCERDWENMDNEGLGIGSLYMWAKEDSPKLYRELTANDLRTLINKSLSSTHYDIAKVMYEMYKDEFIFGKSKTWYQFIDHRWRIKCDGICVKQKLSTDLLNEYMKYNGEIGIKIQHLRDNDDAQKDVLLGRSKKILDITMKLRGNSFKKSIVDECIELFYNEEFEDLLDTNVNLIGFENGVYDLEHGLFRKGNPDDYISFSTQVNYEEFESDNELVQEANTFVQQVLPNKDVREYMLHLLASFLDGKITEEKFHIWWGSGGNGKSKLIELFQNGFGDYCTVLPCSLITQKRPPAETCSPVLVKTKGKRFGTLQEPEKGEKINVGLMKELTGGDKISARALYKTTIEFKPQMKLALICNDMPEVTGNDDGTWRRIRVVQYSSKFRENPNLNDPTEFKIDKKLPEKLKEWAEAFMFIVIQYYKSYKENGIYEPAIVKLHTQSYKNDSDCYAQFFTDKLQEDSSSEPLHIDEVYYTFKEWLLSEYNNHKAPPKRELKANMIQKYGQSNQQGTLFNGISWIDSGMTNSATAPLDDGI
jgi:P4 family phage/plasmid primase-like protien